MLFYYLLTSTKVTPITPELMKETIVFLKASRFYLF